MCVGVVVGVGVRVGTGVGVGTGAGVGVVGAGVGVGCAGRPHGGLCARRRVGTPNHQILKIFTILKSLKYYLYFYLEIKIFKMRYMQTSI